MITIAEYVGVHSVSLDWTPSRKLNAAKLLAASALLETLMLAAGVVFPVNPKTNSQVSGETFGGFRPQNCPIGAANSNHKIGLAWDRFDPNGEIDTWCMANLQSLAACGIWLEHPDKTPTWSHWQSVPPGSGNRVFMP